MIDACEDSAMLVELALKALAVLHGIPTPGAKRQRAAGHDIEHCLALVPEPPRDEVEAVVRRLGLNLRTMSRWRVVATYADDVAVERAQADDLVDDHVATALAVGGYVLAALGDALGETPDMQQATAVWQQRATFIAGQDVRSGLPHLPTPDAD